MGKKTKIKLTNHQILDEKLWKDPPLLFINWNNLRCMISRRKLFERIWWTSCKKHQKFPCRQTIIQFLIKCRCRILSVGLSSIWSERRNIVQVRRRQVVQICFLRMKRENFLLRDQDIMSSWKGGHRFWRLGCCTRQTRVCRSLWDIWRECSRH